MKPDKDRQQSYRQRMLDRGYRQFAFWLDSDTQTALKALKLTDSDLSTVVSKAIKQYHSRMIGKGVSSHVSSNAKPVTNNVSSDSDPVSRHVTSNVTSNRYMSPALEDRILALRQAGVTLKDIASKLAGEGYLNAHGEPYHTGTISKAEARAKKRREWCRPLTAKITQICTLGQPMVMHPNGNGRRSMANRLRCCYRLIAECERRSIATSHWRYLKISRRSCAGCWGWWRRLVEDSELNPPPIWGNQPPVRTPSAVWAAY